MKIDEINQNDHLTKQLQGAKDFHATYQAKFDSVTAVRFGLKRSTMNNLSYLIEDQLEKVKQELHNKQVDLGNRLNAYIDEYAKAHPIVTEFNHKEKLLKQIESQTNMAVYELKKFSKIAQNELVIADIMLKEYITEVAQHGLRYYRTVDKFKNGNKPMVKVAHAKLKANRMKRYSQKPSSSVPERSGIENNVEMMPETTATFKCQETVDTNKVADGQSFNRSSLSRFAIRGKKTEGNKERPAEKSPTKPKASTDRPFVAKSPRENIEEKDKVTPEPSKEVVQIASSLKVATEATNSAQKSKKLNVTFAGYPLPDRSGFTMNVPEDHGVSSSGFNLAKPDDMDLEISLESEIPMDGVGDDMGCLIINDHEMEPQMDDDDNDNERFANDDSISDLAASLCPASGSNPNLGSPSSKVSFSPNIESMNMAIFGGNDNNEPLSNDNFGDLEGDLSEGEEDIHNFFGKF